ncbi:MAG: ribonuclease III [Clostridiales Family XIII bacterium]|jgi:ribonuclease-3|nr:ribonuclease III [Clostridiales Family XIII bacterium]
MSTCIKDKEQLEEALSYRFHDESLLIMALTHPSYISDNGLDRLKSNQRLEFLGDAVLDAVITKELYLQCGQMREGELSKLRAVLVREESLYEIARTLSLGSHLLLGNGAKHDGVGMKPSALSDALESIFGAIFLDSSYDEVSEVILKLFREKLDAVELKHVAMVGSSDFTGVVDYKTEYQELIQAQGMTKITYKTVGEEGPPHNKTFYVNLYKNTKLISSGKGKTKKSAEQDAARIAIDLEKN